MVLAVKELIWLDVRGWGRGAWAVQAGCVGTGWAGCGSEHATNRKPSYRINPIISKGRTVAKVQLQSLKKKKKFQSLKTCLWSNYRISPFIVKSGHPTQ